MQGCHQSTHLEFSLTFPWPKLTSTPFATFAAKNYFKKFILCPLLLKFVPFYHFWSFKFNIGRSPVFLVYAMYIHKHVCMCRLFWTLNNIKGYKALNLQSIPTLTNILLCLVWENHVTWKTEILGNHRYVNSHALNRCHQHFETLTHMKISVSFYLHFTSILVK